MRTWINDEGEKVGKGEDANVSSWGCDVGMGIEDGIEDVAERERAGDRSRGLLVVVHKRCFGVVGEVWVCCM